MAKHGFRIIVNFIVFKFIIKAVIFGIFFLLVPWILSVSNRDYHSYINKLDRFITNDFFLILFGLLITIALLRYFVRRKRPEILEGGGMFFITAVLFAFIKKYILLRFVMPPILNDYIIYVIMVIPAFIYFYYDENEFRGFREFFTPKNMTGGKGE